VRESVCRSRRQAAPPGILGAVTVTLLVVAAVLAVGDWAAVHLRLIHVEYILKPGTLVVLVAAAAVSDVGDPKPWVIGALVFGLIGDVGLMLSDGRTDPPFIAGLGAFLIGHVWYLVAFALAGLRGIDVLAGLLVVAGVGGLTLPAVLRGAAASANRAFAGVVAGYAALLSAMTMFGVGTGIIATAIGAVLFLGSDTLIARDRFVRQVPHGSLLVIVTYHLAQFLILIGLIAAA
jgi:uncharacterized membrane protein YhhN